MDVIARCAFGMTIDNLGENDDQFMKFAKQVFSPASMKSPLVLIACKCDHFINFLAKINNSIRFA